MTTIRLRKLLVWTSILVVLAFCAVYWMFLRPTEESPAKLRTSVIRVPRHVEVAPQITNSIGIKLALIPAGEFVMGGDELVEVFAFTPHIVRITRPFYIGVHEVTRGQFAQFVRETHYRTDAERVWEGGLAFEFSGGIGGNAGKKHFGPDLNWRNPAFTQTDDHPAVSLSWNDATAFCDWLGKKEGKPYRLPTEAEWEYACRAGTTTVYYHGDDPKGLAGFGNFGIFPGGGVDFPYPDPDGFEFTAPVGSLRANNFGLFDMLGNAYEWCSDWFDDEYNKSSPRNDPVGPSSGDARVRRGGSFDRDECGSAARDPRRPTFAANDIGFRIAMSETDERPKAGEQAE